MMPENIKSTLNTLAQVLVLLVICIGVIASAQTWTGPTQAFPQGNVSAPLNTASTSQTKTGFLWVNGIGSNAGGYFSTSLAVATSTDPLTKGLSVLFGGKVGALQ